MTFRDDHDAALARAAALEDEVRRLRVEKAALEHENAALRAPTPPAREPEPEGPPAPAPAAAAAPPRSFVAQHKIAIGATTVGVVILALVVGQSWRWNRANRAYERAVAAHETARDRWRALITVDDCLLDTRRELAQMIGRVDRAIGEPRSWTGSVPELGWRCIAGIVPFAPFGRLADARAGAAARSLGAARAELAGPLDSVEKYYRLGDYQDDQYARAIALWRAVAPSLPVLHDALVRAEDDLLPVVHEEIRVMQRAHEATLGRDLVWWRIELGFGFEELRRVIPRSTTMGPNGYALATPEGAAAIAGAAKVLRDGIADAPLELRRELRSLSEDIEHVAERPWNEVTSSAFWERTRDDGPVGPAPPRPSSHRDE